MGKLRDSIKGANKLMDELIVAIGDASERSNSSLKSNQTQPSSSWPARRPK